MTRIKIPNFHGNSGFVLGDFVNLVGEEKKNWQIYFKMYHWALSD